MPRFAITTHNASDIDAICRELDGLPNAIELAALRTGVLTPRHILERLDSAVRLRPAPGNQHYSRDQSVGASLDRTVSQLDPQEQHLLWRLSVFSGSWNAQAAEAVCGAARHESIDVWGSLSRLVSRSLVQTVDERDGTNVRYALLNVVRQYALSHRARYSGSDAAASRRVVPAPRRVDGVRHWHDRRCRAVAGRVVKPRSGTGVGGRKSGGGHRAQPGKLPPRIVVHRRPLRRIAGVVQPRAGVAVAIRASEPES